MPNLPTVPRMPLFDTQKPSGGTQMNISALYRLAREMAELWLSVARKSNPLYYVVFHRDVLPNIPEGKCMLVKVELVDLEPKQDDD